jgi:hypothetical protein
MHETATTLPNADLTSIYLAYGLYLVISICMTIWVAKTLSKSGEVFLVKCFGQDSELAQSTNRLLVIGFYLVNIGFICWRLDGWLPGVNLIPDVGSRIGKSVLVLGLMHFFNMSMIAKFGRLVGEWMHEKPSRPAPLTKLGADNT